MSVQDVKNIIAAIAFIVVTAFAVDARYELAGAEERATIRGKIYANTLQIAAKASTIYRYDLLEAADDLSEEDAARRVQLRLEKEGLTETSRALQQKLDAL